MGETGEGWARLVSEWLSGGGIGAKGEKHIYGCLLKSSHCAPAFVASH